MSAEKIAVISSDDAGMSVPEPGLRRQVMAFSPSMMLVRHRMAKGWIGARHSHPHEQLIYVIRGHIQLVVAETTFQARAGDSLIVPGGVEHQASALEPSEVLDVFTPAREDYAGT